MTITINGTTGIAGVDGSASTPALQGNDADTGIYYPTANTVAAAAGGASVWNASSTFGFKNRIINGGMVINQRGGTITPSAGGTYGIDRFYGYASGGGVFTAVQSTDVPAGSGFVNSNLLTVTTPDSSIGTGDYYSTGQFIEGNNIADLMWGTANAKSVTLSFWVKSSVTGSYSAAFYNSDATRNYPATFTISSANTWQQVFLTIPGPTDGTWLTNNGIGITLRIDLGSGANYNGTANTWNASGAFVGIRTSSNVNWIATNGATFAYTGVQLEAGPVVTSFDTRSIGTELALCQRYYVDLANNGGATQNNFRAIGFGSTYNTTAGTYVVQVPVPMRTLPSLSQAGTMYLQNLGSTSVSSFAGPYSIAGTIVEGDFTMVGAVAANAPGILRWNNSATQRFAYSAEL